MERRAVFCRFCSAFISTLYDAGESPCAWYSVGSQSARIVGDENSCKGCGSSKSLFGLLRKVQSLELDVLIVQNWINRSFAKYNTELNLPTGTKLWLIHHFVGRICSSGTITRHTLLSRYLLGVSPYTTASAEARKSYSYLEWFARDIHSFVLFDLR